MYSGSTPFESRLGCPISVCPRKFWQVPSERCLLFPSESLPTHYYLSFSDLIWRFVFMQLKVQRNYAESISYQYLSEWQNPLVYPYKNLRTKAVIFLRDRKNTDLEVKKSKSNYRNMAQSRKSGFTLWYNSMLQIIWDCFKRREYSGTKLIEMRSMMKIREE